MHGLRIRLTALAATAGVAAVGVAAVASGHGGGPHGNASASFKAWLNGYQEVPAISTRATGTFEAALTGAEAISWRLTYRDLEGAVQQAHVHFAQPGVNGGVSVFLCSNLAGAPAGTQPCPPPPATITGTITPASVVGPADQGIAPGEFAELLAAMRARSTYANVHSSAFPNGEMRGQIWPLHDRRSRRP
ncbi:MAG TPA: CHRD domain-containing protein [Capillimicrobium sp.]|nr:CHRD domain-containing protein [Capillimicrobium sp.]